MVYKLNLFHC